MTLENPIRLIEAAYRFDCTTSEWLQGIARAGAAVLGSSRGALCSLYDASNTAWVNIVAVESDGLPPEFAQQFFSQPALSGNGQEILRQAFQSIQFKSISALGEPLTSQFLPILRRFGFDDLVNLNATDPTNHGCVLSVPDRKRRRPAIAIHAYHRLAAHIASAARLRRKLNAIAGEGVDPADRGEAVLSASGQVEHAVGPAQARSARDSLRDGLARIHAARSRRLSERESLELWNALVAGRWSVVEHFERAGKPYYVAHKNDPELVTDRALTEREQQILGYAELGHSDKLIAYSLGISRSTVATVLARARRKLGVGASSAHEPSGPASSARTTRTGKTPASRRPRGS